MTPLVVRGMVAGMALLIHDTGEAWNVDELAASAALWLRGMPSASSPGVLDQSVALSGHVWR